MKSLIGHSAANEDLDSLTEEFQVWLDSNDLPQRSADELLTEDKAPLDEAQRLYLTEFCGRWEVAVSEMGLDK